MALPNADWNYPTPVRFGAGRIAELPGVVKATGLTAPLLVTDPNLARLPMVTDAMDSLRRGLQLLDMARPTYAPEGLVQPGASAASGRLAGRKICAVGLFEHIEHRAAVAVGRRDRL